MSSLGRTMAILGPSLAALALIAGTRGNNGQAQPAADPNAAGNSPLPPQRPPQAELDRLARGADEHDRHRVAFANPEVSSEIPNLAGLAALSLQPNREYWNGAQPASISMPSVANNTYATPGQLLSSVYGINPAFSAQPAMGGLLSNPHEASTQAFLKSQGIGVAAPKPAGLLGSGSSTPQTNPFLASQLYGRV